MLSSGVHTQLVSRILIATPIAVLTVVTVFRKLHAHVCKTFNCFRTARTPTTAQSSAANTPMSAYPLIQPTSNIKSYGVKDN